MGEARVVLVLVLVEGVAMPISDDVKCSSTLISFAICLVTDSAVSSVLSQAENHEYIILYFTKCIRKIMCAYIKQQAEQGKQIDTGISISNIMMEMRVVQEEKTKQE